MQGAPGKEYFPVSHGSHIVTSVEPAALVDLPAGQSVHWVVFVLLEYDPGSQALHEPSPDRFWPLKLNVPATQNCGSGHADFGKARAWSRVSVHPYPLGWMRCNDNIQHESASIPA